MQEDKSDKLHDQVEERVLQRTAELIAANAFLKQEIADRKRVEKALLASTTEWEQFFNSIPDQICILDLTGRIRRVNKAMRDRFEPDHGDLIGLDYRSCYYGASTPDPEWPCSILLSSATPVLVETTFPVLAGSYLLAGYPLFNGHGERWGAISAVRDITEQKRTEAALKQAEAKQVEAEQVELLRRLVKAQEDEQRRISRELHDQMGQSLAALLLGLKSLKEGVQSEAAAAAIQRLQDITNSIADEMHSLVRELRPPALDDLGLHTALSNYIAEWSQRSSVIIDFHSNGLLHDRLGSQLERAVYRIVQEALNNVIKHANAQNVSVILEKRAARLLIIVEDDGVGFDVEALLETPAKNRRFGLLGMQERAALVGGSVNIESTPGVGTTVLVKIDISGANLEAE